MLGSRRGDATAVRGGLFRCSQSKPVEAVHCQSERRGATLPEHAHGQRGASVRLRLFYGHPELPIQLARRGKARRHGPACRNVPRGMACQSSLAGPASLGQTGGFGIVPRGVWRFEERRGLYGALAEYAKVLGTPATLSRRPSGVCGVALITRYPAWLMPSNASAPAVNAGRAVMTGEPPPNSEARLAPVCEGQQQSEKQHLDLRHIVQGTRPQRPGRKAVASFGRSLGAILRLLQGSERTGDLSLTRLGRT